MRFQFQTLLYLQISILMIMTVLFNIYHNNCYECPFWVTFCFWYGTAKRLENASHKLNFFSSRLSCYQQKNVKRPITRNIQPRKIGYYIIFIQKPDSILKWRLLRPSLSVCANSTDTIWPFVLLKQTIFNH